ncbi:pyridoxamine 5'-phosphate oxidase family protein [Pseudobdellovibrio exovorus]|uniref:General stress protein FMN-binding split barrel domain-containing protein n=1 Tax=Pseudobdellovibrio exovorus JSS TaxID=1184267 RepID=M4V5G0_9BACT|nr:pyridoxamine 5'-phosphate oxidase family protein [Pseudobdellovibrio exovorus]AGH94572.1 hypothetical protein A11Q_352 [Pseudobdellovibrio exovorus JSS]
MKNRLKDTERDEFHSIAEAIEMTEVAMITTVTPTGNMCSRPMMVQEIDADGNLLFFTLSNSQLMKDIRRVPLVNITFSCPEKNTFISAAAVAYESFDQTKMKELWNPTLEKWFPRGVETPDLTLLKLDLQEVEMWDSPSTSIVRVMDFVKAIVGETTISQAHYEKFDLRQ